MKYYTNILERTPSALKALLQGLSPERLLQNEGPDTWNVQQVVSHLIFCEQHNFYARIAFIRGAQKHEVLPAFDMSRQFDATVGKDIDELLAQFAALRQQNLAAMRMSPLTEHDLVKTATHPSLGRITLGQVLSTWAAHDLAHTAQIARIMARQYKEAVGPFIQFLRILN